MRIFHDVFFCDPGRRYDLLELAIAAPRFRRHIRGWGNPPHDFVEIRRHNKYRNPESPRSSRRSSTSPKANAAARRHAPAAK